MSNTTNNTNEFLNRHRGELFWGETPWKVISTAAIEEKPCIERVALQVLVGIGRAFLLIGVGVSRLWLKAAHGVWVIKDNVENRPNGPNGPGGGPGENGPGAAMIEEQIPPQQYSPSSPTIEANLTKSPQLAQQDEVQQEFDSSNTTAIRPIETAPITGNKELPEVTPGASASERNKDSASLSDSDDEPPCLSDSDEELDFFGAPENNQVELSIPDQHQDVRTQVEQDAQRANLVGRGQIGQQSTQESSTATGSAEQAAGEIEASKTQLNIIALQKMLEENSITQEDLLALKTIAEKHDEEAFSYENTRSYCSLGYWGNIQFKVFPGETAVSVQIDETGKLSGLYQNGKDVTPAELGKYISYIKNAITKGKEKLQGLATTVAVEKTEASMHNTGVATEDFQAPHEEPASQASIEEGMSSVSSAIPSTQNPKEVSSIQLNMGKIEIIQKYVQQRDFFEVRIDSLPVDCKYNADTEILHVFFKHGTYHRVHKENTNCQEISENGYIDINLKTGKVVDSRYNNVNFKENPDVLARYIHRISEHIKVKDLICPGSGASKESYPKTVPRPLLSSDLRLLKHYLCENYRKQNAVKWVEEGIQYKCKLPDYSYDLYSSEYHITKSASYSENKVLLKFKINEEGKLTSCLAKSSTDNSEKDVRSNLGEYEEMLQKAIAMVKRNLAVHTETSNVSSFFSNEELLSLNYYMQENALLNFNMDGEKLDCTKQEFISSPGIFLNLEMKEEDAETGCRRVMLKMNSLGKIDTMTVGDTVNMLYSAKYMRYLRAAIDAVQKIDQEEQKQYDMFIRSKQQSPQVGEAAESANTSAEVEESAEAASLEAETSFDLYSVQDLTDLHIYLSYTMPDFIFRYNGHEVKCLRGTMHPQNIVISVCKTLGPYDYNNAIYYEMSLHRYRGIETFTIDSVDSMIHLDEHKALISAAVKEFRLKSPVKSARFL